MLSFAAILCLFYVVACPYTKVEESFNVQAMHDFLFHGLMDVEKFDHQEFPGVVPRSFLGSLVVSFVNHPVKLLLYDLLEAPKTCLLISCRLTLAAIFLIALYSFVNAIEEVYGSKVRHYMTLLMCSQFHLLFYASRPLPNVFALVLFLQCTSLILRRQYTESICYAVPAVVFFRSELIVLFGFMYLYLLGKREIPLWKGIRTGLQAGVICVAVTTLFDSYMWGRWLWPELEVLYYNTIRNKSSDWGVSPPLWYVYSALPRALGTSLLFLPVGCHYESRGRWLLVSALAYVGAYSLLPHKELRFIIYVLPVFNLWSAIGCARIWSNRWKTRWHTLFAMVAAGHLLVNACATCVFAYASLNNYPGGEALVKLHEMADDIPGANLHIDVFSAQNGISRFLQMKDDWRYNKSESPSLDHSQFKFLLVGHPINVTSVLGNYKDFRLLFTQDAFVTLTPYRFVFAPKVAVLEYFPEF